jgi:hypothetical protein
VTAFAAAIPLAVAAAAETAPKPRILLRVEGAIAGTTPEELRAAMAAELGVEVTLTTSTENAIGAITVRAIPGAVIVGFHTPSGDQVARQIAVPKANVARETLTFLAGNLVRNEAAELLAQLTAQASASASAFGVAASVSGQISIGGGAASSSASSAASTTTSAPPPPLVTKVDGAATTPPPRLVARTPRPTSPCDTPLVGPWWGVDFVPRLGSSLTDEGASAVRVVSFGAIGAYSAGLRGFELGGVFNVKTRGACGAQIAGVANVVSGPVDGFQLAGTFNYAEELRGMQLGTVNTALGRVLGIQLGVVSVAASVKGLQLGVVNVATGTVSGLQLGVVNYADKSDASLGVVSIHAHGRTSLDAWTTETGSASVGIEHGGRWLHNVFAGGVRPGRDGTTGGSLTYGLGVRFVDREVMSLDLDALHSWLFGGGLARSSFTTASQLRLVAAVRLAGDFALFAGPTYTVLLTDDVDEAKRAHVGRDVLHEPRSTVGERNLFVVGWPGGTFGLRAEL